MSIGPVPNAGLTCSAVSSEELAWLNKAAMRNDAINFIMRILFNNNNHPPKHLLDLSLRDAKPFRLPR